MEVCEAVVQRALARVLATCSMELTQLDSFHKFEQKVRLPCRGIDWRFLPGRTNTAAKGQD